MGNDPARLAMQRGPRSGADRARTCPYDRSGDDCGDDSAAARKSPRPELVEALSRAIARATAAGDLQFARVAHEALGRLIDASHGGAAAVADLGAALARRRNGS